MIREVLSGIDGVGIYPVFSFVIFFLFFVVMAIWVLRTKGKDFEEVRHVPFADTNKMKQGDNQ